MQYYAIGTKYGVYPSPVTPDELIDVLLYAKAYPDRKIRLSKAGYFIDGTQMGVFDREKVTGTWYPTLSSGNFYVTERYKPLGNITNYPETNFIDLICRFVTSNKDGKAFTLLITFEDKLGQTIGQTTKEFRLLFKRQ